jgi:hypothetical protein
MVVTPPPLPETRDSRTPAGDELMVKHAPRFVKATPNDRTSLMAVAVEIASEVKWWRRRREFQQEENAHH